MVDEENKSMKNKVITYAFWFICMCIISGFLNYNYSPKTKTYQNNSVKVIENAQPIVAPTNLVNLTNNQKAALFLTIPIIIMLFIFFGFMFNFIKKVREFQKMSRIKFK